MSPIFEPREDIGVTPVMRSIIDDDSGGGGSCHFLSHLRGEKKIDKLIKNQFVKVHSTRSLELEQVFQTSFDQSSKSVNYCLGSLAHTLRGHGTKSEEEEEESKKIIHLEEEEGSRPQERKCESSLSLLLPPPPLPISRWHRKKT